MSLVLDGSALLVNAEVMDDLDGGDEDNNVSNSISLTSRRLTCVGVMLSVLVLMLATLGHPADRNTIPGTLMSPLFQSTGVNTSNGLVERPFRCCNRGYEGPHGVCLLGDPGGICCGAEIALLCGAGSTCYLNGNGHPYCCGPGTSGCSHVCLGAHTRARVIERGGICNPISPQGFNVDGTVLYVDAPWNATSRSYKLNGTNIHYRNPPLKLGTGDISMQATIIPHADGRVGKPGEESPAVLYSRMNFIEGTGFVVLFDVDEDGSNRAQVILTRDLPLTRLTDRGISKSVQVVRVDVPGGFRAGIPMHFKTLRSGLHILVFIDGVLANVTSAVTATDSQPVDIDSGLEAPLRVSPRSIDQLFPRTGLDASLANMSILSSAESCIDISTLGRCPIIRTGEPCMPVCQQGFRIDDTAFFIDVAWDINTRTYRLSGIENIQFSEPALNVGTGDITLQATIIPNFDGRVGRPNNAGGLFPAVLYSRMNFFQGIGFYVSFQENGFEIPQVQVVMTRNRTLTNLVQRGNGAVQVLSVDLSSVWRAGIPMEFKILRSGSHILVFIDNVLANATISIITPDSSPIDVDGGLDEPLRVLPTSIPPAFAFLGLEASVAYLSFSSAVETCIDLRALGMCPIMRMGEPCMPVCHQGFGYDEGAYYIDAPWNTNTMSYRFDPTTENISVGTLPNLIGAGNFTMRATIIPLADNQVTGRGAITGVVFAQIDMVGPDMANGFFLAIHQDPDPAVSISLFRDVGFRTGRHKVMMTLPAWRANVPVALTITRLGLNVTIDVNGVQRAGLPQQGPIDIDRLVSPSLILNPRLIFPPNSSSDIFGLNVSVTNLSIQSFVEAS